MTVCEYVTPQPKEGRERNVPSRPSFGWWVSYGGNCSVTLEESEMYTVTLRFDPEREVTVRVANQDLARTLSLAARLEFLNPGLQVTYRAEPRTLAGEDAA